MNKLANNIRSGISSRRNGLTLIELLIAVTLTLVIVVVMVRAFKLTSDEIGVGRAKMDMHNQLRTVTETLRRDLQMATCLPRPRGLNDERTGYFEYVEGLERDLSHNNPNTNSFLGDHDDVLALTVRSDEKPFRGRWVDDNTGNTVMVESNLAEVVWFVVHTGSDDYSGQFRLYRRVLLIRPDLYPSNTLYSPGVDDAPDFDLYFEQNDISVSQDYSSGDLRMNSLEDLANRENRYAHDAPAIPVALAPPPNYPAIPRAFPHELSQGVLASRVYTGDLEGEDLLLNDCVAFDIKVFDPIAPIVLSSGTEYMLDTNDPGYLNSGETPINTGGYVDLGYGVPLTGVNSWFAPNALDSSVGGYFWSANAWCSWFSGYESDGIDQDDDGFVDEGANGVDDTPFVEGIDDNAERETQPPYPYPIRSIQISVRIIEKKTNQVLQKTIKESFVPN